MLYTAFQNKMHDNLYCTYSNYHPKLIMPHTKANNAIISLYVPETRLNTRESTYCPKPGLVPESPQTGQRQKRMLPKHCMNLVFSKN